MLFEQIVVLFYMSIQSFAVATDVELYDANIAKTATRTEVICPNAYSAYIKNCTAKYNNNIKKCKADADAAKLGLRTDSLKHRQTLVNGADMSCNKVSACDAHNDDLDDDIFGCLSQQSANTSALMNNIFYESNSLQSDYDIRKQNIQVTKISCTNTTTWLLSSQTTSAFDELHNCFRSGKWQLVEEAFVVSGPKITAL